MGKAEIPTTNSTDVFANLPSFWTVEPLENLVDSRGISYGIVQPGMHCKEGVPIVRVNNIRDGRIVTDDVLRVSFDIEAKYSRTRLRGGEVLLTLVGSLGESAVVSDALAGWNVARAVAVITVKEEIDPRWIHLCLRSSQVQHLIKVWATTTVQATLNLRDVGKLPIPLPPKKERESIAHVLGTLDDKIELNRRMNRTLEAMAKALFKSWFVDFDPVRAKAEGRQPEGMDAETAALFPDGFGEDGLPRGWTLSTIGEETEIAGGSTPSTKEPKFWDGDYHWVTPKDLSSLSDPILLDTERKITELGLQEISSGLLPKGTVLLSSRAPIGYLAVTQIPVATNQGFISMKCSKRLPSWYVLHWAEYNMEEIKGRANGTTFLEVSKANFRTLGIIVPNKEVLLAFEKFVGGLYKQVVLNLEESRTLAALRDALLPKLLSGELPVGEAKGIVETAI